MQESPKEERTHLKSSGEIKIPTIDNIYTTFYSPLDESMGSCDDCGLVFESTFDLQKHIMKKMITDNGNILWMIIRNHQKGGHVFFSQMTTR